MNKYFKTDLVTYEKIRAIMDKSSGYPSNVAQTWFAPANEAPTDNDENILIAAMPLIADEFIKADVLEISEEDYQKILVNKQITNN
jgi:hypothetical protein